MLTDCQVLTLQPCLQQEQSKILVDSAEGAKRELPQLMQVREEENRMSFHTCKTSDCTCKVFMCN